MNRRAFLRGICAAAVGLSSLPRGFADSSVKRGKPNVLFIAIDDMNDWVGFLGGHRQARTPNMDRLAKRAVNFRNAHIPAPACSPCRNALLFGIEPFHSGLYPFYDMEKVDPDYATAMFGVDVLGRKHENPFFLALGFVKPHLPFVCPREYFDIHAGPVEAPAIKADDLADVPWPGRANAKLNDDLRYRKDGAWEQVRRAYLACISWTDANVGRVLNALEKRPDRDNTIVVLWSDHGYHLGEKRSFRKFSLWSEATRVPFLIWDRRVKAPEGRKCDQAVSLVDVYQTLTDMAGLQPPGYVDGVSLVPWLENPNRQRQTPAITTWGRGNYTIRMRHWRYIRYFEGSEELYHCKEDPHEWENLAGRSEYASKKRELAKWLPQKEAPLVYSGKALHNVVDADKPSLDSAKKLWKNVNAKIRPPLE